jgi:hypothetical protein
MKDSGLDPRRCRFVDAQSALRSPRLPELLNYCKITSQKGAEKANTQVKNASICLLVTCVFHAPEHKVAKTKPGGGGGADFFLAFPSRI